MVLENIVGINADMNAGDLGRERNRLARVRRRQDQGSRASGMSPLKRESDNAVERQSSRRDRLVHDPAAIARHEEYMAGIDVDHERRVVTLKWLEVRLLY